MWRITQQASSSGVVVYNVKYAAAGRTSLQSCPHWQATVRSDETYIVQKRFLLVSGY